MFAEQAIVLEAQVLEQPVQAVVVQDEGLVVDKLDAVRPSLRARNLSLQSRIYLCSRVLDARKRFWCVLKCLVCYLE